MNKQQAVSWKETMENLEVREEWRGVDAEKKVPKN